MQQSSKMVYEPARVLVSAADGVLDLISNNRGDADSILGRASIDVDDLSNASNEIRLDQFCQLFHEAAKQTKNDNFGLHFGNSFQPKQLGAIGYVAISSPTLAAALANMEAYFPAHQGQSSFGLIQENDILWLSYRIFDPRINNRRQDAELSLGMFLNVLRNALGKTWTPLEVRFEHARPDGATEHELFFGAPVKFNRRTNAIAFRQKDLTAKMPGLDPYLFAVVEQLLQSRCALRGNPEEFATVVRNQIKLNLGDAAPGIADISTILGVDERTFQKQLVEHGLTFHHLLQAARNELAIHYMRDPDVPLTDIAMCLGYSELSAFSRAFRSWTGMSPREYRSAI